LAFLSHNFLLELLTKQASVIARHVNKGFSGSSVITQTQDLGSFIIKMQTFQLPISIRVFGKIASVWGVHL
jgi:hypothetical protein